MGLTEFYLVLLGFTGFYRVLLGFTGFYWGFNGHQLVLQGSTGFYLVLPGFTCVFSGFYRVLPYFNGFFGFLLGFIGFDLIKPGFPGFHWVLLDFESVLPSFLELRKILSCISLCKLLMGGWRTMKLGNPTEPPAHKAGVPGPMTSLGTVGRMVWRSRLSSRNSDRVIVTD